MMSSANKLTSAGHALSDTGWLDVHFQSAREEYEASLRWVGMQPGWIILDAGCGGGGFLPLMSELVGVEGRVTAMDLAPENVAHVEALIAEGKVTGNVETRVGSLLAMPFEDHTFDCVWSANVVQYLTEDEFERAIAEMKRVLKPGGTLALKDFDVSVVQFIPMDPGIVDRHFDLYRAEYAKSGKLSAACGPYLAARLRRAGLLGIQRKSWLVERWAPVGDATRSFASSALKRWSEMAAEYGATAADLQSWREAAADPDRFIDNPDFCFREGFVLAVGTTQK